MTNSEVATKVAASIKQSIADATKDGKISKSTLHTAYALHLSLEAVAKALNVDKDWFKNECGVGQPLAYFV